MMDYAAARTKMVDNQIRTTDVTSHSVLTAFLSVPREAFVPAELKPLAYIDEDMQVAPAANGNPARYIMEPSPLAKMSMGAAGVALSYLMLAALTFTQVDSRVSMGWVLAFFVVYTLAELYILPVGLGLFARVAPPGWGATVIAAWFLASFGGNLLSGVVGRQLSVLGPTGFFVLLSALTGAASLALLSLRPVLRRAERQPGQA